jgi:hypothetical protein
MSERHPPPGAAGPPVGPVPGPPARFTLDALVPDLRPEFRPALFPAPLPARSAPPTPANWFAADPAGLPAFDPATVDGPGVDPAEAHAVAAALGCPDLFLIATPPGPARDRCLWAVAAAAARRGERVLVLAPTPADADRLAVLLDTAVRAVAPGEDPADLPPPLADRTSRAQGAGLVAAARRALAAAAQEAEERLTRLTAADAERHLAERGAAADAADAERTARQAEVVVLREQLKQLAQLAAARRDRQVLTGMFWKAVFAGNVAGRQAELEARLRQAEAATRELDDRAAAPADRPPAAAEAEFAAARRQAEAGLSLARRCLAELTADEAVAARRFLARTRVVVTPAAALADPAVVAAGFDRLVVASAEAVPEAAFRAAARSAARWVLSGSTGEGDNHFMNRNVHLPRKGPPATGGVFVQLWNRLHRPAWRAEDGRLVCRLADVGPGPLCCEPCADRPDVELRFGLCPAGTPVVAEIAFPAAGPHAAADAKAFLARELGEVRLNPLGPARWSGDADRVVVEWPAGPAGGFGTAVEPGVCEHAAVVGGVPVTTRVTFDTAAGWDRASAEQWVAKHAAAARSARTARLPAPAPAPEPEPCLV